MGQTMVSCRFSLKPIHWYRYQRGYHGDHLKGPASGIWPRNAWWNRKSRYGCSIFDLNLKNTRGFETFPYWNNYDIYVIYIYYVYIYISMILMVNPRWIDLGSGCSHCFRLPLWFGWSPSHRWSHWWRLLVHCAAGGGAVVGVEDATLRLCGVQSLGAGRQKISGVIFIQIESNRYV